jgi:hypothetical protein
VTGLILADKTLIYFLSSVLCIYLLVTIVISVWDLFGPRRQNWLQVMQLGGSHPAVATTMANTAGLLKALGKHSEAETVYRTVRKHSRCLRVQLLPLLSRTDSQGF